MWAFAITAWEIFTDGEAISKFLCSSTALDLPSPFFQTPYAKLALEDVYSKVPKGEKLEQPRSTWKGVCFLFWLTVLSATDCNAAVFGLLNQCWAADANQRPAFARRLRRGTPANTFLTRISSQACWRASPKKQQLLPRSRRPATWAPPSTVG